MPSFYPSDQAALRTPGDNGTMDSNPLQVAPQPLEPEDYYYEGEKLVFTAAYHLKRGYCCGSGCRHCPYPVAEVEAHCDAPPPEA
jgi:hypothetical protein